MSNIYSESLTLRTRDCDMEGRWRPGAILEAMQEAAGGDCSQLGIGREVTIGMGIVWVASRYRVELARTPRLGETIRIETFAMPTRHLFFPRMFVFRDEAGERVGGAHTLWLLMDIETRKVVKNDVVLSHLPDNSAMTPPVAAPGTVRPLDSEPRARELTPQYCDFDINGHVNNTRYLDWCCNALGMDALREAEIAAFDINYESEIRPDTALRTELRRQGDRFTFCGFAGEKRCFIVGGELRQKE